MIHDTCQAINLAVPGLINVWSKGIWELPGLYSAYAILPIPLYRYMFDDQTSRLNKYLTESLCTCCKMSLYGQNKGQTHSLSMCNVFYHAIVEIFWPQPIRSLKLSHVTGQGFMTPTWVGQLSDPGKNSVRKWIMLLYIDYIFKIKVKK